MSCLSSPFPPFFFFFFVLPEKLQEGGEDVQPLHLLTSPKLFHPPGITGSSSSSVTNTVPPFQSQSIRQTPKMSEITFETFLEGVGSQKPSPTGDFSFPARPGTALVSPVVPQPRPSSYPEVLRVA